MLNVHHKCQSTAFLNLPTEASPEPLVSFCQGIGGLHFHLAVEAATAVLGLLHQQGLTDKTGLSSFFQRGPESLSLRTEGLRKYSAPPPTAEGIITITVQDHRLYDSCSVYQEHTLALLTGALGFPSKQSNYGLKFRGSRAHGGAIFPLCPTDHPSLVAMPSFYPERGENNERITIREQIICPWHIMKKAQKNTDICLRAWQQDPSIISNEVRFVPSPHLSAALHLMGHFSSSEVWGKTFRFFHPGEPEPFTTFVRHSDTGEFSFTAHVPPLTQVWLTALEG